MARNNSTGSLLRGTLPFVLAGCSLLWTSCVQHLPHDIHARYWAYGDTPVLFPEDEPGSLVERDLRGKANVGICLSGGGMRSMVASVGGLRGLHALGVLDNVKYISGVSGGAWGGAAFTFIPEDRLLAFLEDYVPPNSLTMEDLEARAGSMIAVADQAYVFWPAAGNLFTGRGSESYSRAIGANLLEGAGIGNSEAWIAWSDETAAEILLRNPSLAQAEGYVTVPEGRPFLITGSTLRRYDPAPWEWATRPGKRVPYEYTPHYSGVRPTIRVPRQHADLYPRGYVETFAVDSISPSKASDGIAAVRFYHHRPFRTSPVFTLSDMVGSSGAALGEFSLLTELFGMPKFYTWSPEELHQYGAAEERRAAIPDGGTSENLGIVPLLARRVPRIIALANAVEPVRVGGAVPVFPSYINGLFGRPDSSFYWPNHVFPEADLLAVAAGLEESVGAGGAAVCRTRHQVLDNPGIGVQSYEAEILWVFLDCEVAATGQTASDNYIGRISNLEVRHLVDRDRELRRFPRYRTALENELRGDVIRLSELQAALLAHYEAWQIHESRHLVRAMIPQ